MFLVDIRWGGGLYRVFNPILRGPLICLEIDREVSSLLLKIMRRDVVHLSRKWIFGLKDRWDGEVAFAGGTLFIRDDTALHSVCSSPCKAAPRR